MIWLRALVAMLIGAPVLIGVGLTLATAWGADWAAVLAQPGLWGGLWLTLVTGIGATVLSLVLSVPLGLWIMGRPWAARWLAPMLAVPHAALAVGLAFLIAPSGWFGRALAQVLGWAVPPAWPLPGDPYGAALVLGLVLKELPFLLLMTLASASQVDVTGQMAVGRSLGYAPGRVWTRVIWPQLYPGLRLPVFIVLAYGLSVVDMALILGPSHPPTLAVQILRLYTAPEMRQAEASALAIGLVAITAALAGIWWLAERACTAFGLMALRRGRRGIARRWPGLVVMAAQGGLFAAAMAVLALWSVTGIWRFPDLWPEGLSLALWARGDWIAVALRSLWLGLASVSLALALAVAVLEGEHRAGRPLRLGAIIVAPLLLPQIGFLQGLTTGFLWLGLPAGPLAVIWAEVLFVFPYVLLSLGGPWRALDPDQLRAAASLGAGPWRQLWRVRLPLLARPIAAAAAVGFAVSVAQYLAVLLPGAGRVATLTTEAVALASGADRRVAAVYGLAQAVLPLLAFALALALPAYGRGGSGGRAP
ncbi:ABC transporter permease subunit [Sinirhodobacter sp. HNIBRBA609]|nr:ABC transporter permease subunit [Sinirhodobacter sp. HNIBRBA609]